jgi:branched-chain amino acid transport system ATP-binding protein
MSAAAPSHQSGPSLGASAFFRGEALHKRFGGVHAVRDISLAVPAATVFAIIGPNGAGKSTLLNLMSGIYQPDAGRLIFDGVDLVGEPAHRRVRRGMARTFQKIRLFKHLSVLENVIAGFHLHHDVPAWQYIVHGAAFHRDRARCRDEAVSLLAFVGLERRAHVLAGSLPYGEQRALEIARALATSPRLLMVDEPAAGLNAAEVEMLLDRIGSLRARGVTVVVVEHNMDLVMSLSHHIVVFDRGRPIAEGDPETVRNDPRVLEAYLGV